MGARCLRALVLIVLVGAWAKSTAAPNSPSDELAKFVENLGTHGTLTFDYKAYREAQARDGDSGFTPLWRNEEWSRVRMTSDGYVLRVWIEDPECGGSPYFTQTFRDGLVEERMKRGECEHALAVEQIARSRERMAKNPAISDLTIELHDDHMTARYRVSAAEGPGDCALPYSTDCLTGGLMMTWLAPGDASSKRAFFRRFDKGPVVDGIQTYVRSVPNSTQRYTQTLWIKDGCLLRYETLEEPLAEDPTSWPYDDMDRMFRRRTYVDMEFGELRGSQEG